MEIVSFFIQVSFTKGGGGLRVISGRARGTKLRSVAGQSTRPTTDRVKESLFKIIGPAIAGGDFLDLYAGNGGIGLEALSRGAQSVIWIDRDPACTKMIQSNLEKTRLTGGTIYTNDVLRALRQLERAGKDFDYIFLDPPYERGLLGKTLELLDELTLLKKDGIIIAEASKKEDAPQLMSKLCLVRIQHYGDTTLRFYQNKEATE